MRIPKFSVSVMVLGAALSVAAPIASRADQGPFDGYQGSWSGAGSIATTSGSERIRCRAVYAVGDQGSSLRQNLICASDSYRFEVVSSVAANGGRLSGSWSETTRGVSGQLTGSASDGHFNASVSGAGFTATISVASSRNRQSVTITPRGADVTKVSMTLQKGG